MAVFVGLAAVFVGLTVGMGVGLARLMAIARESRLPPAVGVEGREPAPGRTWATLILTAGSTPLDARLSSDPTHVGFHLPGRYLDHLRTEFA
jgi:hypothetical protein